jgi:predicted phage terminase large subunit-like protein
MASERYVSIFGVRLGESGSRWVRNSNTLEYPYHGGSFYNTTVGGQITGKGLDLGLVDDPVKGRAEASSKSVRDKVWGWFTDDFFTRFSDSAGLLIIMTRWHVDDLLGRFMERFPEAKLLRYPAIAEEDEKNRRKGEALFPEHKSLPFLIERRRVMTKAGWESEYQQNPIVVGGGIFPIDKLDIISSIDRKEIRASVRYVDKAGTKDGGAYSAMVLMHRTHDKQYIVEDVVRGQWSALEREQRLRQAAQIDETLCPAGYTVWVEQEPGSGGKESAENTIRNLAGFSVKADKISGQGSKETRAEPFAAQVQGGNVALKAAAWNRAFMDELESFPSGKFKDQVDAASGAFNKLALTSNYNWSGSWI